MSLFRALIITLHAWFDAFVNFVFGLYYKNKKQIVSAPNAADAKILLLSATELAKKIRQKELKSSQVVETYINRIKEVNGLLNALVDDCFEEALKLAKAVDEDIAKGVADFEAKPLLGVPFTSKESTHCKGMNISFGLKIRKGIKASEDADIIRFMKEAGAILLGVSNIPQVNLWWETHNTLYGITNNPYDTTRCVGGSSGGEGALVAACASPFGVGTDIGGSTRIPAYMCGVFGHKPTAGLTCTKGLTYRDGSEKETTILTAGPIVRKAEDLVIGIKTILGPCHKVLDLDAPVDVTKLRVYYVNGVDDIKCSPVNSEISNTIKRVVAYLSEKTGSHAEELNLEGFSYVSALAKFALSQECDNFGKDVTGRTSEAVWYKELLKYIFGKSDLTFAAIIMLINNNVMPTPKADWAHHVLGNLQAELMDKLSDDGILIFPSNPLPPHYHHLSYLRPFNFNYFSIFNVSKFPATQVPMGLNSEGVPLGVQIVAGPKMDRLCVAVARALEENFGGYVTPFSSNDLK